MKVYISDEEALEIQAKLPPYYVFSYVHNKTGLNTHISDMVDSWDIDLDVIFNDLYNKTYQEFIDEKWNETQTNAYYVSCLIEKVYKPIGQKVIDRFMGRNNIDGINLIQSKHVTNKARHILDFLNVGSLTNALDSLNDLEVDQDPSAPEYWITQERIDLVKADIINLMEDI